MSKYCVCLVLLPNWTGLSFRQSTEVAFTSADQLSAVSFMHHQWVIHQPTPSSSLCFEAFHIVDMNKTFFWLIAPN